MSIYGISTKGPVVDNRKIAKKVNPTKTFEIFEEVVEEKQTTQNAITKLSSINPFIMLNEISNDQIEKEFLKKNGRKVIASLNAIRIGILTGEFKESQLLNLSHSIDALSYSFQTEEIINLVEEIKLRAEVELAKLQKSII